MLNNTGCVSKTLSPMYFLSIQVPTMHHRAATTVHAAGREDWCRGQWSRGATNMHPGRRKAAKLRGACFPVFSCSGMQGWTGRPVGCGGGGSDPHHSTLQGESERGGNENFELNADPEKTGGGGRSPTTHHLSPEFPSGFC